MTFPSTCATCVRQSHAGGTGAARGMADATARVQRRHLTDFGNARPSDGNRVQCPTHALSDRLLTGRNKRGTGCSLKVAVMWYFKLCYYFISPVLLSSLTTESAPYFAMDSSVRMVHLWPSGGSSSWSVVRFNPLSVPAYLYRCFTAKGCPERAAFDCSLDSSFQCPGRSRLYPCSLLI